MKGTLVMDKLIDKIGSYNILNNLIPGAIFIWLLKDFADISIVTNNIVENIFVYYLCGMIISRVGSLIIDPICIKTKLVKYAPKDLYIIAAKKDTLVGTLLETSNLYRTLAGMALTLAFCKLYSAFNVAASITQWIIITILFVLFVAAYRKQTKHIVSRVASANNSTD